MSQIIKTVLFSGLFLYLSQLSANQVTLVPVSPEAPTAFGAVDGVIGFRSEVLNGGVMTASSDFYQQSMNLDASGGFSVPVAADTPYQLSATLTLDGMPDVNYSARTYPALVEGGMSNLDLRRGSGRLVARVNVIGGTAQLLSISASTDSTDINGINEKYSFSAFAVRENNLDPEITGALPRPGTGRLPRRMHALRRPRCRICDTQRPVAAGTCRFRSG